MKMEANSSLSSGRGMVLFDAEALEGGVGYSLAEPDCFKRLEGPGTPCVFVDLRWGKSSSEKKEKKGPLLQLGMGCQGCEQGGARVNMGCGKAASREESRREDSMFWTRASLVKVSMVSILSTIQALQRAPSTKSGQQKNKQKTSNKKTHKFRTSKVARHHTRQKKQTNLQRTRSS